MSASSGSTKREIDEYQDESLGSSGSYESSSDSSDSSSQDEYYSSKVLGFPLKDFQEEMQHRMTSRTEVSSSRRSKSPNPLQDENIIYSCALEVAFILDMNKLTTLVGRYQISLEFRPHLPESGEWCYSPLSGFGVYASYLLAGLRFPLNPFCRDLFHRLGIAPN